MGKLIYDGESVYELDEECVQKKKEQERNVPKEKETQKSSARRIANDKNLI